MVESLSICELKNQIARYYGSYFPSKKKLAKN